MASDQCGVFATYSCRGLSNECAVSRAGQTDGAGDEGYINSIQYQGVRRRFGGKALSLIALSSLGDAMSEEKNDEIQVQQRGFFKALWSVFSAVLWGLCIGVAINCVLWYVQGYPKLMQSMKTTYHQQMQGISLRQSHVAAQISKKMKTFTHAWRHTEKQGVKALKKRQIMEHLPLANKKGDGVHRLGQGIEHFLAVMAATLMVMMAKCFSVLVSFWVFVFAALIGAMDGLLKRYIRTNEGGRESTFIFHRVSQLMITLPVAVLFFYLTLPVFVRPEVVAVGMSVMVFLFFNISTANLKKFL